MNTLTNQRALLIGGGLIGSSVGCAMLQAGLKHLMVLDTHSDTRRQWISWIEDKPYALTLAEDLSALGDMPDDEAIRAFDWILLAVPESATALWLTDLSEALDTKGIQLKDTGAIITLNSTQVHLAHVAKRLGLASCHVPVHPIMGSEQRGFSKGGPMAINGATAVVGWQHEHLEASNLSSASSTLPANQLEGDVAHLLEQIGFEVQRLKPSDHDMYYAVTSHLTHLLAVIQWGLMPKGHASLEPPSFAINRRLAQSDAHLWSQVLHANRESLDTVIKSVEVLLREARLALREDTEKAIGDFWMSCQKQALTHMWRDEIDAIDIRIAQLLSDRLQCAKAIGREKRDSEMPIVDPTRENTVFKRVQKQVCKVDQVAVKQIYQRIVNESRAVQGHA